jgi:undecaprenyl diphosphate synthase
MAAGDGQRPKACRALRGMRRGRKPCVVPSKRRATWGFSYLTLYGFSIENWKRPAKEIADLMGLLRLYLRKEISELHREGVRIRFIGDRSMLAADIILLIEMSEQKTRANTKLDLVIALSYGSRQEITAAVRQLVEDVAAGEISADAIDEKALEGRLYTADMPDPDLIVRTSGEQRISNFLLWQSAYAELVFTDVLWPDFSREKLEDSIEEFSRRGRRYGATTA